MTITRVKAASPRIDGFIAAAPDSAAAGPIDLPPTGLKAKRGIDRSQISVVLPDAVRTRLDAEAERRYMSRSALITMLVNQFLEHGQ